MRNNNYVHQSASGTVEKKGKNLSQVITVNNCPIKLESE